jgi:hypothetical protein
MKEIFHGWIGVLAGAVLLASTGPTSAHEGPDTSVAYVATSLSNFGAYIIDWQKSGRAHVVSFDGSGDGTVAASGARRVITLDTPISVLSDAFEPDSCGDFPQLRQDTLQIAVTTLTGSVWRGTSTVAVAGTQTTLTGCDAGRVVPTGGLDQPTLTARQLALRERPEVEDLRPGVALAGPSEQAWGDDSAAGVLRLQAGGLGIFAGSGNVVSAGFNEQRWLVITQASGTRAYTRLSVDPRSGAEVWLDAAWAAGQPTRVRSQLMVKPRAGAGFGTVVQASRVWESGLFIGSSSPFYISLFPNGTGDRLLVNLDAGTQSHTPITWSFRGNDIVQSRRAGSSTVVRTWVPLRNGGDGTRVVMEDEVSVSSGGAVSVRFLPRVNYYVDEGAAVAP